MQTSALNQMQGIVRSVRIGIATSEIVVRVGRRNMIAIIAAQAVDEMALEPGDRVTLMINPFDVLIGKEPPVDEGDKTEAVGEARKIVRRSKPRRLKTRPTGS